MDEFYDQKKDENEQKKESKGETISRRCLEQIYKKKFLSIRPDFLMNPETNTNLELDGYNEELRIAFEYNGIQHYVYPNWTHQKYEDFIQQVRRDIFKYTMCIKYNIYLIIIPYHIELNHIYNYILSKLPENI